MRRLALLCRLALLAAPGAVAAQVTDDPLLQAPEDAPADTAE